MKKKQALAILIASSMALSIVGCSGSATSASEGSSEMEVTEEEKMETAKAEMIASDNASSIASSVEDAATIASSEDQVSAAASTSSDKSADTTPVKLADHEIMYNGKAISVFNDSSKTLADLGSYDKKITDLPNEVFYTYEASGIEFSTYLCDGKELPVGIDVDKKGATTSRNISVGDTKDKVVSAYGNPSEKSDPSKPAENTYYYKYNFDNFSIWFYMSTKNNTVVLYEIDNIANVKAKDKAEKDSEKAKTAESTAAASSSASTTAPVPATSTEQTAPNTEKYGACGKAFSEVAKKSHEANSNAKYALLYLTKDQTPELVVDNPGHSVSLYTFENGKLITMISDWNYGVSPEGYGTTSYCYLPYENTFLENTNNCLAFIDHYEGEESIVCDHMIQNMNFYPNVSRVASSYGNSEAPKYDPNKVAEYKTLSHSGMTEEAAKAKLADTRWQRIEGNMDYNTLISEIERLGL